MSWPVEEISSVAQINPKLEVSDRPDGDEVVSFVPMAAVSSETVSIQEHAERSYSEVSKGYTSFRRGDVLVAKITPCFENGKMAFARDLPHELGFGTTEFHVLRPSSRLMGAYLFYLLRAPYVRKAGALKMKGAAGQRRVPADFFGSLRIPVPPLPEQKRIAAILDAADTLRAKRRESLAQLDTLLQSVFLDVFGDPVTNPKQWETRALKDTESVVQIGPFGSLLHKSDYMTGGVPIVNPTHIVAGRIEPSDQQTISRRKAEELSGFRLQAGDVVMGRRGEMGRCAIVSEVEAGLICGTGSLFVRPDPGELSSLFLAWALSSRTMRLHLESLSQGVTMPNLNRTKIENLAVVLPPIELQNHFAAIVRSIQGQRAQLLAHLAALDTLFASLQSRAFQGEL